MTLEDIERIPKNMLTPDDLTEYLGTHPHSIRLQAQDDPSKLGFPVIVTGTRVRIPKLGFVFFCRYGRIPSETVPFINKLVKEATDD